MEARMSLVNTRNNVKERATKLIQMYADGRIRTNDVLLNSCFLKITKKFQE